MPNRTLRKYVRQRLIALRVDLTTASQRWHVTNYLRTPDPDQRGRYTQRKRAPWEYPENRLADWRVLRREIGHMIEQLGDLATVVDEQIARFLCTGCGREIASSEIAAGFTTCERCPDPEREAAS